MIDRHLRVFIQAADSGSFSKASKKLYISTNAVIKQINLLEQDLGITLFIRTPRGIQLTKAGELIYREGRKMIAQADRILEEAKALETPPVKKIRVGVSLMNPIHILMEEWGKIADNHSDIQLDVVPYEDTKETFRDILHALGKEIDVIACPYDTNYWGDCYQSLFLRSLPMCITCSGNHPLAKKERLTIEDLFGETVLLRKRGCSPSIDQLRDLLEKYPQIRLEDVEIIEYGIFNDLVSSSRLMISYECWNRVHPLLVTLPVAWKFSSPYGLIFSKNPFPELKEFLNMLAGL